MVMFCRWRDLQSPSKFTLRNIFLELFQTQLVSLRWTSAHLSIPKAPLISGHVTDSSLINLIRCQMLLHLFLFCTTGGGTWSNFLESKRAHVFHEIVKRLSEMFFMSYWNKIWLYEIWKLLHFAFFPRLFTFLLNWGCKDLLPFLQLWQFNSEMCHLPPGNEDILSTEALKPLQATR